MTNTTEPCPKHLDEDGRSIWEQCSWILEGGAVTPNTQLRLLALSLRRELRLEADTNRLRGIANVLAKHLAFYTGRTISQEILEAELEQNIRA